jgi:hypothetical protein
MLNELKVLGSKKGYEVAFLGEFYRVDGTFYKEYRLYNQLNGGEFYGTYKQCIDFLGN